MSSENVQRLVFHFLLQSAIFPSVVQDAAAFHMEYDDTIHLSRLVYLPIIPHVITYEKINPV